MLGIDQKHSMWRSIPVSHTPGGIGDFLTMEGRGGKARRALLAMQESWLRLNTRLPGKLWQRTFTFLEEKHLHCFNVSAGKNRKSISKGFNLRTQSILIPSAMFTGGQTEMTGAVTD